MQPGSSLVILKTAHIIKSAKSASKAYRNIHRDINHTVATCAAHSLQLCVWGRVWCREQGTGDESVSCRDAKQNPQGKKTCLGRQEEKHSQTACVSPQGRGADAAQLFVQIQMLLFSQENYHGWKPTGWGWDLDLRPASAARHRGIGDKINKHEQFPCSSLQSAVHFWHKITAAFWWQHAIKQLLKYFP